MRRKTVPCFMALAAGIITVFGSETEWFCILVFVAGLVFAARSFKSKRLLSVIAMFFMCGVLLMFSAMHAGAPKIMEATKAGNTNNAATTAEKVASARESDTPANSPANIPLKAPGAVEIKGIVTDVEQKAEDYYRFVRDVEEGVIGW